MLPLMLNLLPVLKYIPALPSVRVGLLVLLAGVAAFAGWKVRDWQADAAGARWERELREARAFEQDQCLARQNKVQEVSRAYQGQLNVLRDQLNAAKRVYHNQCVAVSGNGPAGGHHATTGGAVDAGSHAVASESLIEYAGDAERYRLQLIACQEFVRKATHVQP